MKKIIFSNILIFGLLFISSISCHLFEINDPDTMRICSAIFGSIFFIVVVIYRVIIIKEEEEIFNKEIEDTVKHANMDNLHQSLKDAYDKTHTED